jgi:nicotinamidase/pyrazinamidase
MKDEYAIAIIRKGYNPKIDSYSVFYENDKVTCTGLTGLLRQLKIENVFICGVATDYCCYYSAMDAKKDGFNTYFILDLTKALIIPKGNIANTIESMRKAQIKCHYFTSNQ